MHTRFRLVPSTDLDDLERRNTVTALILRFFFEEFNSFAGRLCHSG